MCNTALYIHQYTKFPCISCWLLFSSLQHKSIIEIVFIVLFQGSLALFYELFQQLEQHGVLDPTNEIDLVSLHHVFIPLINASLLQFRQAWMHHKLRTEGNKTPLELWNTGSHERYTDEVNLVPLRLILMNKLTFGYITTVGVILQPSENKKGNIPSLSHSIFKSCSYISHNMHFVSYKC